WLCAALVFPLQIGMAGAPAPSLLFYLLAAGGLLSLADALHDFASYGNWQVALFECLLRVLGLTVPAVLAYTLGTLAAPDDPVFDTTFCDPAYAMTGSPAEIDWPGDGDCLVAGTGMTPSAGARLG